MKLARTALLALAVSALFAGNANAAEETATFNVSITISNVCTIAIPDIGFGPQTSLTASVATNVNGTVDCSGGGAWDVSFSTGGSGSIAAREMTGGVSGSATIEYNLYADAAHTPAQVLGDGTTGVLITGSGDGTFPIYAQTTAGQSVENGSYNDSITATLTF